MRSRFLSFASRLGALATLTAAGSAMAQVPTFAGNAQHTQIYTAPVQRLNKIKWTTDIDLNTSGAFAHYGAPLITPSNTIMVPVKTATDGFQIDAFTSAGVFKYTVATDFIMPTVGWRPPYQPVLTPGPSGMRMYYQGAGGSVWYVDDIDSATPTAPARLTFFSTSGDATDTSEYDANVAGLNAAIKIATPLTADSNGTIFFGFQTIGTAPAPLNTTQSGFARIDASGNATYVLASSASVDAAISRVGLNAAPALSADDQILYVSVKATSTSNYCYLLALDANTLSTVGKAFLKEPRNPAVGAQVSDFSTASPMVAPDGDVYYGVMANPYNGSRGWLLRFNSDLTIEKTSGAFGWDYTPAVIPASMVPSYTGTSSYLLYCKYNNYPINDGDGTNKVAILDPNSTQIDPHPSAPGLTEMREVLVMISPTRDNQYPAMPLAAREWCINAAAVNPANNSIYFNCEDGRLYRWDLSTNALSEGITLNAGIGQPYVPTIIGPDGTLYTLNGGLLFAIGDHSPQAMVLESSNPDVRTTVVGSNVTFTATITGIVAPPTGTMEFTAITHNNVTTENVVLASGVPVNGSGQAQITTNAFLAGGAYLGNYHVTAKYTGPESYDQIEASRYQKLHASATTTTLGSGSPTTYGSDITLTATVASNPSGGGTPTGMVTFMEGSTILGQRPLDGAGQASFTVSGAAMGSHSYSAVYNADTYFEMSTGTSAHTVESGTTTTLGTSPNPSTFGSSVAITATVAATVGGAGTPSGTVTFTEGATVLGSAPVGVGGLATINLSTLSVGNHSITASFVGTGGFLDSSDSTSHDVNAAGTNTSLGSSPNPSVTGQTVVFTATVTSGGGTPTGTVTFSEGATTLGTMSVNGSGVSIYTTSALALGGHTITATYNPTGGFTGSSGNVVHNVVNDTTPPSVPINVAAIPGPMRGQVRITWSASTDPDDPVSHYEVWRANKVTGPFGLIGTTTGLSYVDNAGKGRLRFYYVIAVDSHGNRSAPSLKVSAIGARSFVGTGGKIGVGYLDPWAKKG